MEARLGPAALRRPSRAHLSPAALLSLPQAARPGPSLGPLLFPDPVPPGEEEEEEEEWSGSYQPLAVERAHLATVGPASPSAGSFFCEGAGLAGSEDPSVASLGAPPGPGFHSLRQPSYEEVSSSADLPAPFSGRTQTLGAGSFPCQESAELVLSQELWCQPPV